MGTTMIDNEEFMYHYKPKGDADIKLSAVNKRCSDLEQLATYQQEIIEILLARFEAPVRVTNRVHMLRQAGAKLIEGMGGK